MKKRLKAIKRWLQACEFIHCETCNDHRHLVISKEDREIFEDIRRGDFIPCPECNPDGKAIN